MFRMSRASLLARLPLYCSAECATPTNTSLFAIFPRNLANAPLPPESFCTCFVCATHAHSHFCPQPAALASVPFGFVLVRVQLAAVGQMIHNYDEIICSIHQGGHPASHHDPPVGGPWWGSFARTTGPLCASVTAGELAFLCFWESIN